MKALVKTRPAPGLDLIDVPDPVAGPNQVIVEVMRTGICGTDVHIDRWDGWAQRNVEAPRIVGHEFCGRIVELGSEVDDLEVGQFVSGEGHYVCGRCRACLAGKRHLCRNTKGIGYAVDGAYCQYFAMPAANVWVHHIPGLDPDVAAIFDPFGNAVHTALQFPCLAEDVLVSGAGPIGIMAALVAQFQGARNVVVTDLSDDRLALARTLGLRNTVNVGRQSLADVWERFDMKEGFDIGLEMSGSGASLTSMIDNMAHGGRIALLGTPTAPTEVDFAKIIFSMLTLQGVTGRQIFETWYAMSSLLRSGLDISPVITDRVPVAEYRRAFDIAGNGHSGKVVMNWEGLA
ncbi:L-threonine 3-dehydrogenase [Acidipropionibacterium acidipropionici]|jgi:threonine 3-dehydrogenase|uniref:L-threonine 3-dehydrogenase n=1 Tax=Acidipropionibacterium acidipropionici TaxID=1748 RepID=A0AAC9FCJ2_9ACTN|nr:L-threonine 3-dehydrogenase [Acidipropionibacterium acidipropionici]AMS06399.1 L-threonine 3-dehydrogenase [Acidipropionibacterium acidipropionici]AOZ47850.1 L-threonine 3-dehydrogenase [Acidipropionibacterium acidipropionici]AZP38807.1 L-threonine 3-dehydrogenase [Acidipropionibacterium acidipropionici]QCV95770.1 L-threonine 3-dehydrogenase [Acidipropionibacterium acidipropionici]